MRCSCTSKAEVKTPPCCSSSGMKSSHYPAIQGHNSTALLETAVILFLYTSHVSASPPTRTESDTVVLLLKTLTSKQCILQLLDSWKAAVGAHTYVSVHGVQGCGHHGYRPLLLEGTPRPGGNRTGRCSPPRHLPCPRPLGQDRHGQSSPGRPILWQPAALPLSTGEPGLSGVWLGMLGQAAVKGWHVEVHELRLACFLADDNL